MKIRDAEESDLPAIVEIYNAAIPGRMATADLKPVSVESRLPWYREHSPNSWPIWVIESEQNIVGWLSLQIFYGRAAYQHTAEVSIYVAPDRQRCGCGRPPRNRFRMPGRARCRPLGPSRCAGPAIGAAARSARR